MKEIDGVREITITSKSDDGDETSRAGRGATIYFALPSANGIPA